MICSHCHEEILVGELAPVRGDSLHKECMFRCIVGSVGHLQQRCSCYGLNEADPPGMTPRQAAQAAYKLWLELHTGPTNKPTPKEQT